MRSCRAPWSCLGMVNHRDTGLCTSLHLSFLLQVLLHGSDSSPPPVALEHLLVPASPAEQPQALVTSPWGSFVSWSLTARSDSEQDPHPGASLNKQRWHGSHACLQAPLFNVTLIIVTQNGHTYRFLKFRNVTARDRTASLWPEDCMDYPGQDKSGWIFALLPYSSY